MTISDKARRSPRLLWLLRSRVLGRVVFVVSCLAIITDAVVLVLSEEPLWGYIGVVVGAVGLVLSLRYRLPGLVLVVLGAVAAAALATEYVALWTVVVFVLFAVTVRGTRGLPAFLIAGPAVYLSIVFREHGNFQDPGALVAVSCLAAGAAVGAAIQAQKDYLRSIEQRAIEAEAAAELAVERGIAEERLRIARDLHDAVGHEVAVISMNLGVAEIHIPADSEARTALDTARTAVQNVLREIQLILDILRRGENPADRAPVAEIGGIPALVQSIQASGGRVMASIEDVGMLNPAVSAAAFRIAQEALTNAQRYGVGTIELSVSGEADQVVVDVRNPVAPGRRAERARSGYGIVGMRERAESVGGRLEASETAGVFHVRAVLDRRGGEAR